MHKSKILFLLIFFSALDLIAQSDTLFVRFSNSGNLVSHEIIEIEQGYVILNYNSNYTGIEDYQSINIVDFNGNIIRSLDTVRINNILIENIQIMHRVTDGIILLANVKLNFTDDAFISIRMDYDLENIYVVDTLFLNNDEDLRFIENFKDTQAFNTAEGFGTVHNTNSNQILENIYIEILESGEFGRTEILTVFTNPTFILDFVHLEDQSRYFLTFWNAQSLLLDESFSTVNSMYNTYTYQAGDTTYHPLYTFYGCDYNGQKLVCAGNSPPKNNYNFALSEIEFAGDTLFIKSLQPLLPTGTKVDIVTSSLTTDAQGNYIGTAISFLNPFNMNVEPNTLYATKLDENLNMQWQIAYNDGNEIALSDFIADKNGDLAVIGGYWDEEFLGQYQGFLFKILHDGSLTSSRVPDKRNDHLLKIYPCPASDKINVEIEPQITVSGDIISLDGSILQPFIMASHKETIDISKLPAGNYYIRLFDENLNFLAVTRFIKI